MPKLKPGTESQRRDAILDAAEQCFSRAGFHRTTMQDICKEAAVSPGALYTYFASKEDLIAGLCERDRSDFTTRFQEFAQAPDLLSALDRIANTYFVDDPIHKRRIVVEMGIEATRNPRVAEAFHATDRYCLNAFETLFARLRDDGRIAPTLDVHSLAQVFHLIGDGLNWRRAVSPDFDGQALLPSVLHLAQLLINPLSPTIRIEPDLRPTGTELSDQVQAPLSPTTSKPAAEASS